MPKLFLIYKMSKTNISDMRKKIVMLENGKYKDKIVKDVQGIVAEYAYGSDKKYIPIYNNLSGELKERVGKFYRCNPKYVNFDPVIDALIEMIKEMNNKMDNNKMSISKYMDEHFWDDYFDFQYSVVDYFKGLMKKVSDIIVDENFEGSYSATKTDFEIFPHGIAAFIYASNYSYPKSEYWYETYLEDYNAEDYYFENLFQEIDSAFAFVAFNLGYIPKISKETMEKRKTDISYIRYKRDYNGKNWNTTENQYYNSCVAELEKWINTHKKRTKEINEGDDEDVDDGDVDDEDVDDGDVDDGDVDEDNNNNEDEEDDEEDEEDDENDEDEEDNEDEKDDNDEEDNEDDEEDDDEDGENDEDDEGDENISNIKIDKNKCKGITGKNEQCCNPPKYGKYCGVHNKKYNYKYKNK